MPPQRLAVAGKAVGKVFEHGEKRHGRQLIIIPPIVGMRSKPDNAPPEQQPCIGAHAGPADAESLADLRQAEFTPLHEQQTDYAAGYARFPALLRDQSQFVHEAIDSRHLLFLWRSV